MDAFESLVREAGTMSFMLSPLSSFTLLSHTHFAKSQILSWEKKVCHFSDFADCLFVYMPNIRWLVRTKRRPTEPVAE